MDIETYGLIVGTRRGVVRWPDTWLLGDVRAWGLSVQPDGAVLVGAWSGAGLWRVGDEGNEHLLHGSVRVIVSSPVEPGLVFAGTKPVNLYRSRDGGRSWERLPAVHGARDLPFPDDHYVRGLAIPRSSPATVYLGVEGLGTGGVLRSPDRGDSWEPTSLEHDIHALVCPGPVDRVYAASGHGFFASEDGGHSWEMRVEGIDESYPMGLHRAASGALYLGVAEGPPPYWRGRSAGARAALYRSDDEGMSWARILEPGRSPFYAITSAADGTVFAGREDGALYVGSGAELEAIGRVAEGILSLALPPPG